MDTQREKTTNDENENDENVLNKKTLYEESKKITFEKNNGVEKSKTEEKIRDYKKDDIEEVIITEEKLSVKETSKIGEKDNSDQNSTKSKKKFSLSNIVEYFNKSIHYTVLTIFVFPFWAVIFGVILSIQEFLKADKKNLFSTIVSVFGLINTAAWLLMIVIVLGIIAKKATNSDTKTPSFLERLSRTAFYTALSLFLTTLLLYGYNIGWNKTLLLNLTIPYLLTISFFTSFGTVKLYEWIFTGNVVDEKIKLKLSFINKILVGGFGLIATVLGIALTIKKLLS